MVFAVVGRKEDLMVRDNMAPNVEEGTKGLKVMDYMKVPTAEGYKKGWFEEDQSYFDRKGKLVVGKEYFDREKNNLYLYIGGFVVVVMDSYLVYQKAQA
ncbi:hypothetical protein K7432_015349 [Basidiobolus ranarum]|uniref:Uncharacterized protein n=1 Tax=Basidiobolus ranarum TaxID=34480 RepID=A0ABR2WGA1_9FUNG